MKTYRLRSYRGEELHDVIETTDLEEAMSILTSEIVLNGIDKITVETI